MEFILRHIRHSGQFGLLYLANLLLGFHIFTVYYVHSSFLALIATNVQVGVLYAVGSSLAILTLATVSLVLEKIGTYKTLLWTILIQALLFLGLAHTQSAGLLMVLFVSQLFLLPLILFCLDICIEVYSTSEDHTGNVRGIFLSMATVAGLFSPFIAGILAGPANNYRLVYFASALFLVPLFLLVLAAFRRFEDPTYHTFSPRATVHALCTDQNFTYISLAQFLMRFFFSWMVIYMPLYLHTTIGFSWPEIGLIFSAMLVPYVLIEFPAGIIADTWLGEKELLIVGFVLTAGTTALLSYVTSTSVLVWAGLLFATRVGAALIEIMTESYFFKHTKGSDADAISFFRMQRPLAYVLGPLSASLLLVYVPLASLWFVLACVVLIGAYTSLKLVDTR